MIDDAKLAEAAKLGMEVLKLFQLADFRRVRVGFNKLIDGLKSNNPTVRLHEFVRSIDGLMALEKGKSTRQFGQRSETFATLSSHQPHWECFTISEVLRNISTIGLRFSIRTAR